MINEAAIICRNRLKENQNTNRVSFSLNPFLHEAVDLQSTTGDLTETDGVV